ncbi:MAG TPA: hypothetical protein VGP68_04165 [Gemmataceae bacterium]|jgi:hypothetical protein|nr:hypothetical protein [Gemmataceae bacterium]
MKAVLIHASVPILYIGAYGNEAVRTPELDWLAAEGIVFDAHETDGGGPEQFLRTLITGRHAFAARAEDSSVLLAHLKQANAAPVLFTTSQSPPSGDWTLSDSLPGEIGMTPIAEAVSSLLDRLADYSDWFFVLDLGRVEREKIEVAVSEEPPPEDEDDNSPASESDDDTELLEEAADLDVDDSDLERVEEDQTETDDEAEDLEPAEDPAGSLDDDEINDPEVQSLLEGQAETTADAEDFDVFFGWLRAELEERGLWDDSVLIFTGQGDSARPDGLCSEGPDHPLRPSLSRLPLIVRLPAQAHSGRRVAALTQPADLTASLLSWLGQPPAAIHGNSLAHLCESRTQTSRAYTCAATRRGADQALALTTAAWKYLLLSSSEGEARRWLFRQPEDRFGRMDLYQQKLDFAERLEACLLDYVAAAKLNGPVIAPELPSDEPTKNPEAVERKEA